MAKIKMKKPSESLNLTDAFNEFKIVQSAKGVKDKTLKTYSSDFLASSKHLDMSLTENIKIIVEGVRRNEDVVSCQIVKDILSGNSVALSRIFQEIALKNKLPFSCGIFDRNFQLVEL